MNISAEKLNIDMFDEVKVQNSPAVHFALKV